ncbi:unnamed protein product [Moneuplotes crassus]|uniref:Uncharacterized protein n=1 Tax=Euplotes crassus TaxID=5936 RepID=A0AAD2D3W3_EUPCR|nr:unnamed protein product [Moneuplotes crassus]
MFESLSMLRSNIINSLKVGRFYQAKSSDEAGIQTLISTLEMRMIAVVNTYGRRKMSLRHLYTGKTLARKALMH